METSSLKLTTEQKMVLKSRMNGNSFWEIEEDKHRQITDEIILSAASIFGMVLPETELLATYLSDEMITLIMDFGYDDFTVDEIMTALRFNTYPEIKNPSGDPLKQVESTYRVSVVFLAGVLRNYKILRSGIDRMLENKLKGY